MKTRFEIKEMKASWSDEGRIRRRKKTFIQYKNWSNQEERKKQLEKDERVKEE